jgi:hypothetical protein
MMLCLPQHWRWGLLFNFNTLALVAPAHFLVASTHLRRLDLTEALTMGEVKCIFLFISSLSQRARSLAFFNLSSWQSARIFLVFSLETQTSSHFFSSQST